MGRKGRKRRALPAKMIPIYKLSDGEPPAFGFGPFAVEGYRDIRIVAYLIP